MIPSQSVNEKYRFLIFVNVNHYIKIDNYQHLYTNLPCCYNKVTPYKRRQYIFHNQSNNLL